MLNFAQGNYKLLKVSGLWDWPSIKTEGVDWSDEDYTEISNRCQDFQYNSRIITLDCIISAGSWGAVKSSILGAIGDLYHDGLEMLVLPNCSQRGYMVRLQKTTIFEPIRYFKYGKCVAEFKIVYEEPQPFNAQFSLIFPESGNTSINLSIINSLKSRSIGSDKQKFVTISFLDTNSVVNIEEDDFNVSKIINVSSNTPYPCIITGEIDALRLTGITSSITPTGIDVANYFLRNGEFILS